MQGEKTALLLASLAVIGVFFLDSAMQYLSPGLSDICEIGISKINQNVRVRGEIAHVKEYGGSTKLVISNAECQTTVFIPSFLKSGGLHLNRGWCVELIGTVKLYDGGLEISTEAENLWLFSCENARDMAK